MKFTLSLVVLAAAASQAAAVVPTPILACTQTVVVQPTDNDGCAAFAARNGITFAQLKEWNTRLREDCLNLDLGEKICISVTPGAGAVPVNGTMPGSTTAAPVPGPTPTPTLPVVGLPTTATASATGPTKSPTVTGASAPSPSSTKNDAAGPMVGKTSLVLGLVSALLSFAYVL